ncbi:probable LRR receptor-like serine/threonine-protein kinase At1g06840 isoform X1 [Selaginella moellendorffii]|uniref:probable LRR receptor-like serine/threonine-protein kinase At1g06840 isoform X1 n=1 Tax=Selaginella moellendorffii TaxID=88036 RepID=UPI000D1C2349|nr:probable LRR receptor-like serine/threonine-protein kinase At1g06840 isoform X1 [Selaginella moellendorffii]XP_024536835.1 probable LRR receptor-like serine/threonine-protein kinase At1g06840 isoform X1 [Selaginella moellendorffii]|eukprot:XP_024536834.1 probable LRR receptor-like serine/threonine-protein kinase At1g06840 isoform X1 [Selaginella moellendorffii]
MAAETFFKIFLLPFALAALMPSAAAANTDPGDVRALNALHKSLKDTAGRLQSWNNGDPCNDYWEGIICSDSDLSNRTSRSVLEIHLMNCNLTGTIAPEVGDMANLQILNLMWNGITGTIPANLGNAGNLELLLLNGNKLTGTIPEEIGNLMKLNRFQIDENQISGSIPSTFGNLVSIKHLHMNNNSLTGIIPPELGRLPTLFHILADNNNLSGPLPAELSNVASMQIIQLDNNNFGNASVPPSYVQMKKLLKLSMRNCNLGGMLPDIRGFESLEYLDVSGNSMGGNISQSVLPPNVTTINLANNNFGGQLPSSLAHGSKLQALLLQNNQLSGLIPIDFVNRNVTSQKFILDLRNNLLTGFDGDFDGNVDANMSISLSGNSRVCTRNSLPTLCSPEPPALQQIDTVRDNVTNVCTSQTCSTGSEMIPALAYDGKCRCAAPIQVQCRLKSPGFTFFSLYRQLFSDYLASNLSLLPSQVFVDQSLWEPGPRLFILVKIFPPATTDAPRDRELNSSEVLRVYERFAGWKIRDSPIFGPRELIAFIAPGNIDIFGSSSGGKKKHFSKAVLAGVLVGAVLATALVVGFSAFKCASRRRFLVSPSKKSLRKLSRGTTSVKIDNVKAFTFHEMGVATDSFSEARQIGKGGYGKVYKGILDDKQVVAIKRADEESHQGETEFFTEIELLSRIHHRNLVSLVGFCLDGQEQMLVYEYIGGGNLSSRLVEKPPLNFKRRVYIALGAARGIMYLHTEAEPRIIHRDIKGTNILIGDRDNAKVADFGLSKLAPEEDGDGVFGQLSTVVKGTPGYLDPEYFLTRKLSDKSDIYSFGVVMLELVTGRQAISHGKNLVREVRGAYEAGVALSIVDPLMGPYPSEAMEPFVRLALTCCADNPDERPSIRGVVRNLEDIWKAMASWAYSFDDDHSQPLGTKAKSGGFDVSEGDAVAGSSSSARIDELDVLSTNNIELVAPR